jgi:hypothetical protein
MPGLFETLISGTASMTFDGSYRFASPDDLDAAIEAVRELLESEEEELAGDFDTALRRRGVELRIHIDTECPRDWYYAYATLVEMLAERAVAGTVEGRLEGSDHVESYVAAAASHSLTKMKRVQEPAPTWDSAAAAVADALAQISGRTEVEGDVSSAEDKEPARPGTEPGLGKSVGPRPRPGTNPGIGAVTAATSNPGLPVQAAWADDPPASDARRSRPIPIQTPEEPASAAVVRNPDRSSVADRVAAATVELTKPPALTRVPELTSLGKLMTVPELSVPQLVLIPELVPPAELGMLTRSVTVVAGDMVTPDSDLADALSEIADSVKAK